MLTNYLKIALRTLWRSPLYSLLNMTGLALGIACCLLIALYVYDEWSYDRFHRHADQIYRVVETQQQADGEYEVAVTPGPLAPTIKSDFPEVVEVARYGRWSGLMKYGKQVFEEPALYFADNSLLRMFDFPLVKGNLRTVLTRPDELVMTETAARKYFGEGWQQNPSVIGSVLRMNDQQNFRVVGILKDVPANSHLQFGILLSFEYAAADPWNYAWGSNNFHTYVQLRPGTDAAAFREKLKGQLIRYNPKTETKLALQRMTDIHLHSRFAFNTDNWTPRGDIFYVRLFATVGLIVLLIACVNFINLSTARSARRAREVGVRKTIGAFRWHLVLQFLGESALLTVAAVAAAVLLASALLPLFNELTGKQLSLNYVGGPFWLSLGVLTVAVSVLAGLYPAVFLSGYRPAEVLKGGGLLALGQSVRSRRSFGLRQMLVVGQFGLSLVLIIGTVFIFNQLRYMQQKSLGFEKSQLLYVRMGGNLRQQAARFKEELLRQSSIQAATTTTSTLVDVANESNIAWEGGPAEVDFLVTQMNVDPDFLPTVGMKLASGRNFRIQAAGAEPSFLVNETAARRMGLTARTALNKRVEFWGTKGRIVGVVRDFHFRPLNVPIAPFILRYAPAEPYFQLLVRTRPGRTPEALAQIQALYARFEKDAPLSYGFVNEELDRQYRAEERTGQIMKYFAGLAIFVSCLGLFGLSTFTAEQRTKEIGIRKVLGASVASVVALLSKDFLKLVLIAFGLASPVAWWAVNRWLQNFAYRIDTEWWVFALAGLLAIAIALLTISFQSLKAALVNPASSLRKE
ncbi:ABC transporter permease [Tellurirhabdus rosea]|uniref:ABC transporter permease n=1 Tax=Tellurirhabdus rosea TaxID=2674997 RepID=UPI002252DC0A|nr:ABC transporter permease [Tellurirhabdus rosea]